MTTTSENPVPISIEFIQLNARQRAELEAAFPNADVVASSAFSGKQVLSLLVDTSKTAINQLAELFQRWKDSDQEVKGKIGDVEFSVKGFGANDTAEMIGEIRKIIKDAKK